jgi:hypothetical protein
LRSHQEGDKLSEGKDPLPFTLYKLLCSKCLISNQKDLLFVHVFLIMSWNLMCRAGNCVSIHFNHLSWKNDSLQIRFGHMKNDQEGDRPKDPRHVYANPVNPEICPILSLAIYLSIFGFSTFNQLFPGKTQYNRFSKAFKRLLESERSELERFGLFPEDLGCHSTRKGSATYVSSCSTAGPSASSICLRAGWSLPGVQDTYIRYESAGDMIVGRFVSGLPFEKATFATLPPFFNQNEGLVDEAVRICFGIIPLHMKRICEFSLASLVYHAEYLRKSLPLNHILFETTLFKSQTLLNQLKNIVFCRIGNAKDSLHATGIPPHIGLLVSMEEQIGTIRSLASKMDQVAPSVVDGVIKVLEERAIGAGTVTREGLDTLLSDVLARTGIIDFIQNFPQREAQPHPSTTSTIQPEGFYWNNAIHSVPEDFEFPQGNLASAWEYWCCGDESHSFPPYKLLQSSDMSNRNKQKRLSDFKCLMKEIEALVQQHSHLISNPSITEAKNMFNLIKEYIPIDDETSKKRTRRPEHLKWNSALNLFRNAKKLRTES